MAVRLPGIARVFADVVLTRPKNPTALADFCRRAREEGVVVAWISLDEDDARTVFGAYPACAFERGGLDLTSVNDADGWPSSPAYQVGLENATTPATAGTERRKVSNAKGRRAKRRSDAKERAGGKAETAAPRRSVDR